MSCMAGVAGNLVLTAVNGAILYDRMYSCGPIGFMGKATCLGQGVDIAARTVGCALMSREDRLVVALGGRTIEAAGEVFLALKHANRDNIPEALEYGFIAPAMGIGRAVCALQAEKDPGMHVWAGVLAVGEALSKIGMLSFAYGYATGKYSFSPEEPPRAAVAEIGTRRLPENENF